MARENPLWGAQRIRGEMLSLGYEVDRETVRRYMHQARRRPPSQTWRTFVRNHAPEIWDGDFFTVPTVSFKTLYVFFFIEHGRRKLMHVNVTAHPTADWVWRQLIQATPWGEQPHFLLRDRDASFGTGFVARARAIGIETVLSPFHCPQANGVAERMVGTFRRQCLDHVIVLNERHLLRVVTEYVDHYNRCRPHRSLELRAPEPRPRMLKPPDGGRVIARPVLGGVTPRILVGGCLMDYWGPTRLRRQGRADARSSHPPSQLRLITSWQGQSTSLRRSVRRDRCRGCWTAIAGSWAAGPQA